MTTRSLNISYRHIQYAWWLIALMLALVLVVAAAGPPLPNLRLILAAFFLIIALLFHSLTIEIGEGDLRWHFGPGLIRKSVALAEIGSAHAVRTNIFEGWGIHLSRFGWLYNVSGFHAVAITLRSGKRFALGTDEPQELCSRLIASSGARVGPPQNY
jgi:hypothetical protein